MAGGKHRGEGGASGAPVEFAAELDAGSDRCGGGQGGRGGDGDRVFGLGELGQQREQRGGLDADGERAGVCAAGAAVGQLADPERCC